MRKDASILIEHVLESIANIEHFMSGVSKVSFMKNKEKQSAVIRQLEIVGEAVKNLPEGFRNKHPHVPWKDIAGMRDKLLHHYFGIDLDIVWKVWEESISDLKRELLAIKQQFKKPNN